MLRILQNEPRTNLYNLYSSFNTLPVNLLFELFTMKLIYSCLNKVNNVPNVISDLFIKGSAIHTHNTRQKSNFILQTNICHNSIAYYGPSM